MDWAAVRDRAARIGGTRMLLLGLYLAHELLGASPPATMLAVARGDASLIALAAQVLSRVRAERFVPVTLRQLHLFRLRARERFRDRMVYVLRRAMTITAQDWQMVRLPASLTFLYYPLRALRIARRRGQRPRSALPARRAVADRGATA
jgi:hypothetical protein